MTYRPFEDPTISAKALRLRLGAEDIVLLDATWTFSGGPVVKAEGRIDGAAFFDIDRIVDPKQPNLPHMLAPPEIFGPMVASLGVSNHSHVVVYDRIGTFSAPRAWWSFRAMGHERVQVLDGGLPAFLAVGGPVSPEPAMAEAALPGTFRAAWNPALVRNKYQMRAIVNGKMAQIVDARPEGRFRGHAPEPRPGLPSGHMPGAKNIPWPKVIAEDGRLAEGEHLAKVFGTAGIDPSVPLVATCGSGVTACILALAAAKLGRWDVAVYDGSWAEWASDPKLPIATG